MNLDVDFLINFYRKHSGMGRKGEMGEQEAAAPPAPTGGGGKAMPKWEELYGLKKGKANPATKAGSQWSTGLNRGVANQIW